MPSRAAVLEALEAKPQIDANDVLAVRPLIFDDMLISPDEADALFRINDGAASTCPEWKMLFVEAMTDYVVRQQQPAGYVDAAKADWLVERIARDGRVRSATELELLVYVLERADWAPPALAQYALEQVVAFALAARRAGQGAALTADEVGLIRRAIYAFSGSGGGAAVSRAEAEALFDLNDAARGQANDPAWTDLFVHGVGAAVMRAAGYAAPPREEALRREAWLKAPAQGTGSILAQSLKIALRSGPFAGLAAMAEPDPQAMHNRIVEGQEVLAAPVDQAEVEWLVSRIGRDGVFDDNELALLGFIAHEAPEIPPALQAMIDRADSPPADARRGAAA